MTIRKGHALLLASLMLVGCMSGGTEPRATLDVPGNFTRSGALFLPGRWWNTLGDDRLAALIEESMSGNPQLDEIRARLRGARARLAIETGAEEIHLDAGGGLGAEVAGSSNGGRRSELIHDASLSASYEVDLWGRVEAAVQAAREDLQASQHDLHAAAISLSGEVALSWYRIAADHARVLLIEDQLGTQIQVLDVLRARFARGLGQAEDVLRQRQLVESRRGELEQVREALRLGQIDLAVLLGRTPTAEHFETPGTLITPPPLPRTGLPAELVRLRPDLQGEFSRIAAAEARVGEAIAATWPRLDLGAGLTTGGAVQDAFESWSLSFFANLFQPLLDGDRRRQEVEVARADAAALFARYRSAVLLALGEVEAALEREERRRGVQASLAREIDLANQVLNQARTRYRSGVSDYLNVLDAIRTQQTLELDQVTARSDRLAARIALLRALSTGWPVDPNPQPAATPAGESTHE